MRCTLISAIVNLQCLHSGAVTRQVFLGLSFLLVRDDIYGRGWKGDGGGQLDRT